MPRKPWLLAPNDLQAIKAAGVTFPLSMLERVIEEQARGAPEKAEAIRRSVQAQLGGNIRTLVPGSAQAAELKRVLIEQGAWSQYLEVGIGPDAEIFTKGQPMSAVGHGMEAGLHPISTWNNPEPEVVLVVNSQGRHRRRHARQRRQPARCGGPLGAAAVEGQGQQRVDRHRPLRPLLRWRLHARYGAAHVEVSLRVEGEDGFELTGRSSMAEIARDPADLVKQLLGRHHQYPDGAVLFLGTMFSPVKDRGAKGQGFTHKKGDVTLVSAPELGTLANRMTLSTEAPPWQFGTGALMRNLAQRGLL